jgi:hypothetical protein
MNPYQGSLGNVTLSGYTTQANPIAPIHFDVNITLTDTMSGRSGSITANGIAFTTWVGQANGSWALGSSIGVGSVPESLKLGNNLYTVWIGEGWSTPNSAAPDSTVPISAPIDVTVTPGASPEPGTLALAVCGLSLVGFRVRRLRGQPIERGNDAELIERLSGNP